VITVWRICTKGQARKAFSGEGAAAYGGRWNSPGTPVVYTAGSRSLAALEILVNTMDPKDLVDLWYVAIPAAVNEEMIAGPPRLPRNWKSYPAPMDTMRLGDAWAAAQGSVVLRVPSVVIPAEWNYLLNPSHPDFPQIVTGKAEAFRFDSRLLPNGTTGHAGSRGPRPGGLAS
jgi:RES domain-containing protein